MDKLLHRIGKSYPVFLILTGCSTITRQEVFDETKIVVKERTGQDIVWNTDGDNARKINDLVNQNLNGRLSLDDCIRVALLKNPKLQSKYEDIGIAQADLVQAGLPRNPILDLSRRFPGRAAEFDIVQDFLQLLFIPLRKRISETELEIAKLEVAQSVITEVGEVKKSYYRHQADLQLLEMRRNVVDASEASYIAAKELKRAGNVQNIEVQNEASIFARAKLDLADAEARTIESRENLNVLMGAWGDVTSWTIESRLPDPPPTQLSAVGLESLAVSKRLDLVSARKKIEALAAQYNLSQYLSMFPEGSIGGHFEREPEGDSTTGPSLTIPLPIFDWEKAASLRGAAETRRAVKDYEALAIQIRSDVRSAYGRMISANNRVDYFFKEVLPIQKKVLQETQLLYNGMFVGVFSLLQAKQAQINSGNDYIRSLLEYWTARTELENAVGGRLPEASAVVRPDQTTDHSNSHRHHHNGN